MRSVRSQRKRERDREQRNAFHYRRVKVELRLPDDFGTATRTVHARALLNDLTSRGIKVFTPHALELGTELALTIQAPKPFFVRARVVACSEVSFESRIITDNPLRYRVGLTFEFRSSSESIAVSEYVEQMMREHIAPPRDQ